MKQLLWALAALAALIWGWKEYFREIPHLEQPGVLKNFQVDERDDFSGHFTVLDKRFYGPARRVLYATSPWVGVFNDLAYLSNMDVLLGQGRLAHASIYRQIDFDQHSRCYEFKIQPQSGLQADTVRADSMNISVVAANERIAKQLRQLKTGQQVQLQGKYAHVMQLKTQQHFVVGMNIPRPRPQCAIVKITSIQRLSG